MSGSGKPPTNPTVPDSVASAAAMPARNDPSLAANRTDVTLGWSEEPSMSA